MFQVCVVVSVKTDGLFLKITHNGDSVPALVALWCADRHLFARARWTRMDGTGMPMAVDSRKVNCRRPLMSVTEMTGCGR